MADTEKYRKDKNDLRLKLDDELHGKLKEIAARRDSVVSRLVRRYLREGIERDMGSLPEGPAEAQRRTRRASALAIAAIGAATLFTVAPTEAQAGPVSVDRTQSGYALYEAMRRRRLLEAA